MASSSSPGLLLGDQLARALAAAGVLGRLAVLRDAVHKTSKPLRLAGATGIQFSADAKPANDAAIYASFDLPPTDAVEYLRNLTPYTRDLFDTLQKQTKAEAFTVAGVSDRLLVGRVQDALTQVVQSGGTRNDFRAAVDKLRATPAGGGIGAIDVDGVFQGMTQRAYSAGRYVQLTDSSVMDALPYWQYLTVGDDRVRPEHRCLDHFCALAIDPVWRKIYPPCGYGCRCSVVAISADEAPKGSDDGGLERLPTLALEKVPQPGYQGIFSVAA